MKHLDFPIVGPFRITNALRLYHNHRLDSSYCGYIRRLPDRTLVYASEYEEREYQTRQARTISGNSERH
jgi:hypothetical protein